MLKRNIVENAIVAKKAWESLDNEIQNKLKKYFHIRPTQSGMTVVSVLPGFEMRGCELKTKKELEEKLNKINKNFKKICSDKKSEEILIELGFKKRSKKENLLEENVQSVMIRSMSSDDNLKDKLGCKNRIKFIASELIFEKGKHRADVVGYDGESLFLFELKKGRTTKVDQVSNYVKRS
jgi:pyruvate/oxaloacetate carboxyltransferase